MGINFIRQKRYFPYPFFSDCFRKLRHCLEERDCRDSFLIFVLQHCHLGREKSEWNASDEAEMGKCEKHKPSTILNG